MTIIARYTPKDINVQIQDRYTDGAGIECASIRTLDGSRPFFVGSRYPGACTGTTCPVSDLADIREVEDDEDGNPNLLQLARAARRDQWPSGSSVWLHRKAFLKNVGGIVTLHVMGYGRGLLVYWLDPFASCWKEANNLDDQYSAWAAKARKAVTA